MCLSGFHPYVSSSIIAIAPATCFLRPPDRSPLRRRNSSSSSMCERSPAGCVDPLLGEHDILRTADFVVPGDVLEGNRLPCLEQIRFWLTRTLALAESDGSGFHRPRPVVALIGTAVRPNQIGGSGSRAPSSSPYRGSPGSPKLREPRLAGFAEPLAGDFAGRRELFESISILGSLRRRGSPS